MTPKATTFGRGVKVVHTNLGHDFRPKMTSRLLVPGWKTHVSWLKDTCVPARRHVCLPLVVHWLRLIALRKQLSGRSSKNMVSAVNWFAVIELKQCKQCLGD